VAVYCESLHAEHIENKANKGQRLPENKQKAFNTLRAKVRKGNVTYIDEIARFKEDPTAFDQAVEEEGSEDDSGSSGSEMKGSSDSSSDSSSSGSSDSSSNSDSSDSDSDSNSSDSDSSDSEKKSFNSGTDSSDDEAGDPEAIREKKMLRWLITPEVAAKNEKKALAKGDQTKEINERKGKDKKGRNKPIKEKTAQVKEPGAKEKEEFTPEELMKKVTEISQMRGKRQFVRKDYMEKLRLLEEHAVKQGARAQLHILTSMVSADFDGTGGAFDAMKISTWNAALVNVTKMLPLLIESHEDLKAGNVEELIDEDDPRSHARLQELFLAYVEKLDDELYKALQFTVDVYGSEYQDILANSSKCLILLKRVLKFFEETKQTQPLGLISLRLIEQLYYKPDMLNRAVYEAIRNQVPEEEKGDWAWPEDSKAFLMQLCHNVCPKGKPIRARVEAVPDPEADPDAAVTPAITNQTRLPLRASLCQAYHLALHNNFSAARDLLNLGNLYEQTMLDTDVHTHILYNRVLAQMGLCAFRLGKVQDAHLFLMDHCMHGLGKARELMAQGISFSKNMERTPEQERAEKMRQLPYHMHINLEVLESAHHICAMLLEIPNMAMHVNDPSNKRVVSRWLRRSLEHYDKQYFTGPPENTKESVITAAKALQRGDWTSACAALEDLKLWDHIDPQSAEAGQKVKAMIKEQIQSEALRTYLFAYASIYDAFHLDQLIGMFGLEPKLIHSIVSKMMIREEITAFWDESSKYVLVQHSEPTPLQRLALALADRGAQAVENNERLVDQKSGGYGFSRDQRPQQGAGFGKGGKGKGKDRDFDDRKGGKGKGRGGKGFMNRPPVNRGWENARAGAVRGSAQRGWATTTRS